MRYDVVIIGGGPAGTQAASRLQAAGLRCVIVSEGVSLTPAPKDGFLRDGGMVLPGDSVLCGRWDGDRLTEVYTRNLEDTPLRASAFILATGRFFSRGLVSTMDGISEPVFGCDVQYDADRRLWCDPDFFAAQPFESYGVTVDGRGLVSIGGRRAANLYACGEILAGRQDIVKSVERVCRSII